MAKANHRVLSRSRNIVRSSLPDKIDSEEHPQWQGGTYDASVYLHIFRNPYLLGQRYAAHFFTCSILEAEWQPIRHGNPCLLPQGASETTTCQT